MIIARSPLRITLGGGGTDLPSYYRLRGGMCISAAIDRYVYVGVIRPFKPGIYLKYSELERVETVDQVKHRIIREALRVMELKTPQIEITTLADIPAGTGLGSSGSFTTALLKALYLHHKRLLPTGELARLACEIEIDRLKEHVGKQDQYSAAYGGITCFRFAPDDSVEVAPLKLRVETLHDLEDNLLLFFTGFARRASSILEEQVTRTENEDPEMIRNLDCVKELGERQLHALERGDTRLFGSLLHEHWENKRRRSSGMTNPQVDEWYELGRANGALGGKLVGAGGGGFLMFYAENRRRLLSTMTAAGLEQVRFGFDFEGTKVLLA